MSSFEATDERRQPPFIANPIGGQSRFRPASDPTDGASFDADLASDAHGIDAEAAAEAAAEAERAAEYERGCADGRAAADATLSGTVEALQQAARALTEQRAHALREQRSLVIQLALSIAEKIVGREMAADHDLLASMLGRAIEQLDGDPPVVVQLSNADYLQATKQGKGGRLADLADGDAVRLETNDDLAAGEARVVCGASTVDARMASLLACFSEAFAGLDTIADADAQEEEDA